MEGNMKAIQYTAYGKSLQHVELPIPVPSKNEVLIRIEVASINILDVKVHHGQFRYIMPIRKFPYIPGTDIAGEVVSIGPGVSDYVCGDKVVAHSDISTGGAFAEYVAAPIRSIAKRDAAVPAFDAAGCNMAGISALQSLRDSAGVKIDGSYKGNILITGASGGVGTYAVQLAKLAGAHVTATCGARNVELIKSLGADEVLDYKTPEGIALKSPSGCKFNVVIHCATGIPWSTFQHVLARRAVVVDLTATLGAIMRSGLMFLTLAKQKLLPYFWSPNSKDLKILMDLIKDGKLKTIVDSKYTLADLEQAWTKCSERHATGKILVEIAKL